jgi:membrane associated rhomboid family serine protease
MRRYPSRGPSYSSFSFGPGPLSPAIKALIIANVAIFLLMWLLPGSLRQAMQEFFGLLPAAIFESFRVWQPVTYMFLHDTQLLGHILFNMLALWMFGTELERMWGTNAFLRYYFATGIAAAITTVIVSLAPFPATARLFDTVTIGASGAIYGLLLAYGLTFPNRPIYIYFIFAIPAKYFVMIMGAIALLSSIGGSGGGVAHITHLGGLVAGYVMLRAGRLSPANEVRYRYLRWKMDRARKKFGVYSGGKSDWDKHVH